MTKQDAIQLLGGSQKTMAQALGVTASAVSQWPEELDQEREDRVIGAAVRIGKFRLLGTLQQPPPPGTVAA